MMATATFVGDVCRRCSSATFIGGVVGGGSGDDDDDDDDDNNNKNSEKATGRNDPKEVVRNEAVESKAH